MYVVNRQYESFRKQTNDLNLLKIQKRILELHQK